MKPNLTQNGIKPLIGAHESIAGGIYLAFQRAESVGCLALQVFTKSSNQWASKPLTEEDIANYKSAAEKSVISDVIAHDSYLINLCAKDKSILKKSREAFLDELDRCEALGIGYLNFHPGAHMGAGEKDGIKLVAESLDWVHSRAPKHKVLSVLETTAGQGSSLGYRFEQLKEIIGMVENPGRMAVCVDTCHIFAAGYDISSDEGYDKTFRDFDEIIGINKIVAFHVNDSKKGLGSRVDRHEHIGKGMIGRRAFELLMADRRFQGVPKILETPKGDDLKEDKMNLAVLRKLASKKKGT